MMLTTPQAFSWEFSKNAAAYKGQQMISGSVAVEGQSRGLPPPFAGPPEFLRPPPRAPPYSTARVQSESHIQVNNNSLQSHHHHAPSTASAYPPVPGAYARFTPPQPPPPFTPYAGYGYRVPPPPPVTTVTPPEPPRGKEGSLKHRLLSRERAPPPARFSRGALIELGGGELRKVEDMRTEDFVQSARLSPELTLADSKVVRLLWRPSGDTVTLTLSYHRNMAQVDMESAVEHPFFVYGQGWASCSPERTLQCYGLEVKQLQVGDVCISLIPREPTVYTAPHLNPYPHPHHVTHHPHHSPHQPASATIVTTATTTAMTVRPDEAQRYPENLSVREDSRKRRSSAPDICGDEPGAQRPRTMRH